MDLLSRVRDRKVVQWALVYLAGAWLFLEALGFVAESFGWPSSVVRSAILLAAVGFFAVMVLAWYHGEKGQQRAGGLELALLATLAVVAGTLVLVFGREPESRGEPAIAHAPPVVSGPPAVAVVPFTVRGAEMELWREGLVDLLAINLDGPALRAIDSRTVLARWHEQTAGGVEADLETVLRVGRATGARHVVLGTAVATDAQVRLAAEVRAVEGGELLHQARIDGTAESMISLVDRLSIELLRFLLQEGASEPRTDLASVTTSSIEALKAFLRGENLYRRGEYESADEAYQRAVAADSSFALAYYRLGLTLGWTEAPGSESAISSLARADSLANLPRREAGLVRAALAMVRNDGAEIDSARALARRYPDDPEAWYLLGELYYHAGEERHVGWPETEAAFVRAAELDPRWAPHYIHMVDLAFRYHADSTVAAERMARYRELAPESPWNRYNDWLLPLAFGDSAARAAALTDLEYAEPLDRTRVSDRLTHPRFWPSRVELLELQKRLADDRREQALYDLVFGNVMNRGWLSAGLDYVREAREAEVIGPCELALLEITLRPPSRPFEAELRSEAEETFATDGHADIGARARDLACKALYAAYRGWKEDYRRLHSRLNELNAAAGAMDAGVASELSGGLTLLDGLAVWVAGDPDRAYETLRDYSAPSDRLALPNLWWGRILIEVGRPEEAIPILIGERSDPLAHLYLGEAYEATGADADARDAYRYFLSWWSEADAELQPLVDEARERLARIAARLN